MGAAFSVADRWGDFLDAMRSECTQQQFQSWFARLRPGRHDDRELVILVPNRFLCDRLRTSYLEFLTQVTRRVAGRDYRISLEVDESSESISDLPFPIADPPPASNGRESPVSGPSRESMGAGTPGKKWAPTSHSFRTRGDRGKRHSHLEDAAALASSEADLNPHYSFQNFIVGPSNRVPHAAALAVVASPGTAYNPLFLHGSVGLGKTHLLQAICHALLERRRITRFLYLSCETFVNHFISAIENGNLEDFRYYYRHVDMLLIDDVQFLAKKERTQEEFFHTFNTLYNAQKQIVLTCDSPPSELRSIQERLVSRFNWGLVTHLQLPDYETRVAIIKNKATLMNFTLPEDVAHYTADRVRSNIRDLEGAITKIVGYARLTRRPADLALAREALQGTPQRHASPVTVDEIVRTVTEQFGVKRADLESKKRSKSITFPRQICMYLARRETGLSLEEIGQLFGGRDHTTVLYAEDKIRNLVETDPDVAETVREVRERLRA